MCPAFGTETNKPPWPQVLNPLSRGGRPPRPRTCSPGPLRGPRGPRSDQPIEPGAGRCSALKAHRPEGTARPVGALGLAPPPGSRPSCPQASCRWALCPRGPCPQRARWACTSARACGGFTHRGPCCLLHPGAPAPLPSAAWYPEHFR